MQPLGRPAEALIADPANAKCAAPLISEPGAASARARVAASCAALVRPWTNRDDHSPTSPSTSESARPSASASAIDRSMTASRVSDA
jgi:hypothetical protein